MSDEADDLQITDVYKKAAAKVMETHADTFKKLAEHDTSVAPPKFAQPTEAQPVSAAPPKFSELVDGLNDCTNEQYHADRKYLSSSVLKTVLESLDKYHNDYILGLKAPTASSTQSNFDVGTLVHSMILEPHTVATDFNYYTGFRKAGKEFDAYMAALNNPKLPIISVNQRKVADDMFEAFLHNRTAVELIKDGLSELTICGTLHGVPIKVRMDRINVEKGYIVDVKTTGYGSDKESFIATCENFKYPLSGALYTAMVEQYYGKKFDFYYLVLSKRDKTCDLYKTSTQTMALGRQKVKQACEKYLTAKATNMWKEVADSSIINSTDTSNDSSKPYTIEEI